MKGLVRIEINLLLDGVPSLFLGCVYLGLKGLVGLEINLLLDGVPSL